MISTNIKRIFVAFVMGFIALATQDMPMSSIHFIITTAMNVGYIITTRNWLYEDFIWQTMTAVVIFAVFPGFLSLVWAMTLVYIIVDYNLDETFWNGDVAIPRNKQRVMEELLASRPRLE